MKKYALLLLVIALSACERVDEPLGPSLEDTFGPFSVLSDLSVSENSVDFSNNERIFFEASFNKNANWTLEIEGNTSGAKKVFSGFSRELNNENTNWNGTTTNLPMFKTENCSATLTVELVDSDGDTTFTLDGISVTGTRTPEANVVTDFENGLNQGFNRFVQSGADMRFDTVNDPTGPQGFSFYQFRGDVSFADDLGNIAMPKTAFTDTGFTLNANSDAVYFNVFAKKGPNTVNDIIVFQFIEDDNDNGVFDGNADDLYEFVLTGLTEEWQLYSVKYADLTNDSPRGNALKNPEKLISMFVLPIGLKEPFDGFVDYLAFTENQPLVP